MAKLHPTLETVTARIIERSKDSRAAYLARLRAAADKGPRRSRLSCGNLAHGFAACAPDDKADLKAAAKPNLAIVTSYNDMLSAHQPFEPYPAIIKDAARQARTGWNCPCSAAT
jgi:phosphogluconate dehydratase